MEAAIKDNKTIENKRKRLIFRSLHRGTKEMDIIMGSFAKRFVSSFTEKELCDYDVLLTHNDPDLYNWITGRELAPQNINDMSVFKMLQKFKLNI